MADDGRWWALGALGVLGAAKVLQSRSQGKASFNTRGGRGSRAEGKRCPACGKIHQGGGIAPPHGMPHPEIPLDGDIPQVDPKEIVNVIMGNTAHIDKVLEELAKKGIIPKGIKVDIGKILDELGKGNGTMGEIWTEEEREGEGQSEQQKGPPCPPPNPTFTDADLAKAWEEAKSLWKGVTIRAATATKPDEGIAWINLKTREVFVNLFTITCKHLEDCLPVIYAHELGHHMWYPHTLRVDAEVTVARMAAWDGMSGHRGTLSAPQGNLLENLSYDYLINTRIAALRPQYLDKFVKIYQGLNTAKDEMSPHFAAYMATYEVAWGLPEGTLTYETPALDAGMPNWREKIADFVLLSRRYERVTVANPLPLIAQHILFVKMIRDFFKYEADNPRKRGGNKRGQTP